MSLGWFEKNTVGKTVKKVINRIMRNVDQTIEKNPGLKMEEALTIVDRKQGVFFPGEKSDTKDLKSLFALIVWKGYRNVRLSDPDASSREHRELVYSMVYDYLHNQESAQQPRYKKFFKPAAVTASVGAVVILLAFLLTFHSNTPSGIRHPAKDKSAPASLQNIVFKYYGYASDNYQKLALVNKSVYHEGDFLDEKDGYVLKSIYPKHIVVQNRLDKSEFLVFMQ